MTDENKPYPRLVFLNPWERLIGPNRYLIELLRCVSPLLCANTTVIFHRYSDAVEEYEHLGVQVQIWPEISPIFLERSWQNFFRLGKLHTIGFLRFVRRLRHLRPDILFSNTEMLLIGQWAAGLLNITHLQVFHAISFQYRLGNHPRLLHLYLRYMSWGSRYLIGVSETLCNSLVWGGVPKAKMRFIPNALPDNLHSKTIFMPIPTDVMTRIKDHHPVILSIGKISPMKGQDLLVEALPLVKEHYPDLLCVFAGGTGASDGLDDTVAFADSLRAKVIEAGLKNNILWLEVIDYVSSLLELTDIYVQPSRTESFCRTVAEALLFEKPVVAFNIGALAEVAGPGSLIVPFPQTEALATAIIELLKNPEQRSSFGRQGRAHILQNYEASKVARHFEQLLMRL